MRNWRSPFTPPDTCDDVLVVRAQQDAAQVGWYGSGLWHVYEVDEQGNTGSIITAVHVRDVVAWRPIPKVQPAVVRKYSCS